jgi:hypothetical protein
MSPRKMKSVMSMSYLVLEEDKILRANEQLKVNEGVDEGKSYLPPAGALECFAPAGETIWATAH